MMEQKIFAEMGFGNESFLSTEVEQGKREYRIKKFLIPKKINGIYFRVIILSTTFILLTYEGFKIKRIRKNSNFFLELKELD